MAESGVCLGCFGDGMRRPRPRLDIDSAEPVSGFRRPGTGRPGNPVRGPCAEWPRGRDVLEREVPSNKQRAKPVLEGLRSVE